MIGLASTSSTDYWLWFGLSQLPPTEKLLLAHNYHVQPLLIPVFLTCLDASLAKAPLKIHRVRGASTIASRSTP
jgi:hypothetical protein